MSEFPRFNLQKNDISETIITLIEKAIEINLILNERKISLINAKTEMENFIKGVNNLVNDFNSRKKKFIELAVRISSDLGENFKGQKTEDFWKGELNKDHEEGIFQWMHNQIIDLLRARWIKLNLGSNGGPDTPPNYKEVNFENYKNITNRQNAVKKEINAGWGELARLLPPLITQLENTKRKITPTANQAGSSS